MTPAKPVSTRSGRVSRQPKRLEPTENVCDDDYSDDEYDTDYNSGEEEDLCETETDTEDDGSDSEAENGNLKGFIDDDEESVEEYQA